MLDLLRAPRVDPLWAVAAEMARDDRDDVLDLVVGVYRDAAGRTPVPAAVRTAEMRLAEAAGSKRYRGLSGNQEFNEAVTRLVLGPGPADRATTIQTVAGTGALRLLAELVRTARPDATVWLGEPGYVNHEPVLRAAGLAVRSYRHLGADGRVDADAVLGDLARAAAGDVVLVQGAGHNPTGADPDPALWCALGDLAERRGLVPMVDLAYQGFGRGLEEDAAGLRLLASRVGQVLIAVSCSKNFGLYSERTGAAIVLDGGPARPAVRGHLETIARASYSQPPDHGAAVVAAVLGDPGLRTCWTGELVAMRQRVAGIRRALADALGERGFGARWTALGDQLGLFAVLPLSPDQVARLRTGHAIYPAASGRVNLAALGDGDVTRLADALADVTAR